MMTSQRLLVVRSTLPNKKESNQILVEEMKCNLVSFDGIRMTRTRRHSLSILFLCMEGKESSEPAALYAFPILDLDKEPLQEAEEMSTASGVAGPKSKSSNTSWKNYVASITAGVVSIFTFNSLDTLRVRWQVVDRGAFRSITSYGTHILKNEGFVKGLQLPALSSNMLAVGTSTGLRLGMYPMVRESLSGGKLHAKDTSGTVMFFAGLSCGLLSYLIATPLWSVKTKQQSDTVLNPLGRQSTRALLLEEYLDRGLRGMWRGAAPLVLRGGLISAGQIGGYDFTKSRLSHHGKIHDGPALHIISSCVSALFASTLSLPMDVLFSRYVTERNRSITDVVKEIARERAFFRGWTALVVRLAPTFALAMPIYEQIRKGLGLGFL